MLVNFTRLMKNIKYMPIVYNSFVIETKLFITNMCFLFEIINHLLTNVYIMRLY